MGSSIEVRLLKIVLNVAIRAVEILGVLLLHLFPTLVAKVLTPLQMSDLPPNIPIQSRGDILAHLTESFSPLDHFLM